ncbi:MAG: CoA-binding protein [Acidobacteria bacterium]|nr:CoA-binding protein [Acidobacteriota bacterium]
MTMKAAVDDFMAQRTLALVGASESGKKFGNAVLKTLSAQGYRVLPVHRSAPEIDGHATYRSLGDLPASPGGVVVVVPPAEALQVVQDAAAHGITRVWLQQGAGSPDAIAFCEGHGMQVVHGECILMFAEPAAFAHRAHRFVWKLLGKLPH